MKNGDHDMGDRACVVCCGNSVGVFAVGECDHPVCYECATRMRVRANQNECAICRRPLPKVFFVKKRRPYNEIDDNKFPLFNAKYQIYFQDEYVQEACYRLLEHRCHICSTKTTYATFRQLMDHMRREHDLHYCDLCVESLTVFTHERKCYTRADLARHRRIGDADDKSHRGHPLCEFCDQRYVDNDELFRHLRRDHYYCHFCDADGLHHYYCDYGYLREHFRVEHFLCDDEACQEERFTTAFRSEIDLKAHRAAVHNRNMTKAQAKQARTLELEFTITPRVPGTSMVPTSGTSSAYSSATNGETYMETDDGANHHRRGRRGDHTSQPNASSRTGSSHPHSLPRSNPGRREDVNQLDRAAAPAPAPAVDLNPDQFPVLGVTVATTSNGTTAQDEPGHTKSQTVDTLARKLAKLNRFTVSTGDGLGDTEFPALGPSGCSSTSSISATASAKSSASNPSKSWTTPGNLRVKSSGNLRVKSFTNDSDPAAASTKKTLTVKLNSTDFPGLTPKESREPSISLQVSQTVIPHEQSLGATKNKISDRQLQQQQQPQQQQQQQQQKPVVTRVTSSHNIRFLDSTPKASKEKPNVVKEPHKKGQQQQQVKMSESVHKPSSTKSGKQVEGDVIVSQNRNSVKVELMSEENFPALEKKKSTMAVVDLPRKSKEKKHKSMPEVEASQLRPKKKQGSDSAEHCTRNKKMTISENDENELPVPVPSHDVVNTANVNGGFNAMSVEDFPGLQSNSLKVRNASTTPPPGFGKSKVTHQMGPPPGFHSVAGAAAAAAWHPPPPGFTSVIPALSEPSQSPSPSPAMTFTNSNGQNYTFSTTVLGKAHEYVQPDGFAARNAKLMDGLSDILKNKDNLATFRLLSGFYRKGEITATDYYRQCCDILGDEHFAKIFSELIVLLPDIQKQQTLLTVHKASRKQDNKPELATAAAPQILVCATCQQVLSVKDFRTHMDRHSLEQDFPCLLGSDLTSSVPRSKKATWVQRN